LIVFESRAIARYIEVKHASKAPRLAAPPSGDLGAFARFEQAASIEQANFDALASAAASELIFKPYVVFVCDADAHYANIQCGRMRGAEGNKDVAAQLLKTLDAKLDAYDKILSQQKYLAGDVRFLPLLPPSPAPILTLMQEISLADLFHLTYGALLPKMEFTKLEDGSKPNVARWWKDITARPAWQAVKDGPPGIKA
jgi:glutathione S-transferase